jgi:hypothetical protein
MSISPVEWDKLTKERQRDIIGRCNRIVHWEQEKHVLENKIDNEYRFVEGPDMALVELWQTQLGELEEFGEIRTKTPESEVRTIERKSARHAFREGADILLANPEYVEGITPKPLPESLR